MEDVISSKEEKRVWGIHCRDDSLFRKENIIAIGWKEMGDLSILGADREAFKQRYAAVYTDARKGNIANGVGMLYRFCREAQIGDYVIYPSKNDRQVNFGIIEGEYRYDASQPEYVQTHRVKWLKQLPRTYFSQGALYEIGSALSFFMVKNYADEFLAALDKGFKKTDEVDEKEVEVTAEAIIDNTKDYILKELSRQLKGYDLEEFVADLLRAMGYRTTVSPHGGDSGIDITAYKDELPPRILVQVKSQDGDIKETTIQSLKGAMREGDYGLFITLSDYTKNAKAYLRNTPIIRGINGTELVDLIIKYYKDLGEKNKRIIPLQMVYIPVSRDIYE
jgi:restriction system protein